MAEEESPAAKPRRRYGWRKLLLGGLIALFALIAVGVAVLNSPIGHRYVVERIARLAPASGLKIEIGRIEGSLYGQATLHHVTLSDPKGPFLRVPVVELDWRPFSWFRSGLDVRKLVARRGILLRRPQLNPGDPDAPILPNFDIRIDRLEIDRLTIAEGIAGPARRIDLTGSADIRKGRALVRADGRLGGKDRLQLLLDAEEARNKFDLALDYAAPKDGVLAGVTGAQEALALRIVGKGSWTRWDGALLAQQGTNSLAALRLTNRAGRYGVLGQIRPADWLQGIPARAAGKVVSLDMQGTLRNSVLAGSFGITGAGLLANGAGAVDLAGKSFDRLRVIARLTDPTLLGDGARIEGGQLSATLNGPFREIAIEHRFTAASLAFGATRIEQLAQAGVIQRDASGWHLPLALSAARIRTGNAQIDPRLVQARATGTVSLMGSRVTSSGLTLSVPGIGARLSLAGDIRSGGYALAGPVAARGFTLANLGSTDANADIVFSFARAAPWRLKANLSGRMLRVDNATLTSLAGTSLRYSARVALGQGQPLLIETASLKGSKLDLTLSGRRLADGRTTLAGRGRHADYGPFKLDANITSDGPRAVLVFASPLPSAGLKDVRVALVPIPQGFRIETEGESRLGPFAGVLGLYARPGAPTRIEVERMTVWKTAVTGSLALQSGGVAGALAFTGGGMDGTVRLTPRNGGQGFEASLVANHASFGGANPISLANGKIEASGVISAGGATITGTAQGEGLAQGRLFIGKFAASANLAGGRGQITASLAGRRGSRFTLQLQGDLAPGRMALIGNGEFGGRRITMPRRAVLTRDGPGWRLAPTQVNFGGGRMIGSGLIGGDGTDLNLALAEMPLSLADVLDENLGLGGIASGLVEYHTIGDQLPTGKASLQIKGLTRSGLVLTSRPLDLALVAQLTPTAFETRAVARDGGAVHGRLQGRINGLPAGGTLIERLSAGSLAGQLRYAGPADALWRLVALEAFDLTGPVALAADLRGSLYQPQVTGSVSSDSMRLQSALTGTDISNIVVRGRFAGSRLDLTSFAGRATNGGTVRGSGTVDLAGLGSRAPTIDLKVSAQRASILARDDMAAVVTGPLRIVSNGSGGTIAGRLAIDSARWQLGQAIAAEALPVIRTREINLRGDIAPPRALGAPWRFLIDAAGTSQVDVRGLGIDSEWGANIRIRGTTLAPEIFGRADLVRGGYEFAGKRFEMTRGRISFDGGSPPDPRLDIAAEAQVTGLTARVTVTGTSLAPDVRFSSVPALPEEELLARLLFGDSIANISAPEALQLGAALASLRGGGGLDPLNELRSAIGLDRLRIVSADAALGRSTGIAVGKNITRRLYAEIITDGRGYSATQLEFRVTSWLSLLASVSTIGRESVNVRVSKDY